jgi:hypothetical protein
MHHNVYNQNNVIRVFTRIFAVCLLLAGYVPVAAFAQAAQCEMACCRKAQNASCHRSHTHSGPAFQVNPCSSSCGNVKLGMAPAGTPAPATQTLREPLMTARLQTPVGNSVALPAFGLARYQRPPPASLQ